MINFLLKYPFFYRLYQTLVRKKFDEYDFLQYIINSQSKIKSVRILDLCCADSFILKYIHEDIDEYTGIDFNEHCINQNKKNWEKFRFEQLDLTKKVTFEKLLTLKPNFILVHGAIHHLDDGTVKKIISLIKNYFPNCIFISVDPVKHKNQFLNKLMIMLDRGKFIRSPKSYKEIIGNFNYLITDDFYKMSFKYIFYYNNIDIQKLYSDWKTLIK